MSITSYRERLIALLPAGTFVVWTLYQALLQYFFGSCAKYWLLSGIIALSLYAFFLPYLHHFHETWKGYFFHAVVSLTAFLTLVITSEDVSQCFFNISHVVVNLVIPIGTWLGIAFITLILHKTTARKEKYVLLDDNGAPSR